MDYDGRFISSGAYDYLDSVVVPISPERTGYVFIGWDPEISVVEGDTIYTAMYEPKDNTAYTVKHYIENFDGSYKLIETSILYGISDTIVIPQARNYPGFTAPDLVPLYINADGSAELIYQYTRNTYNLTVRDRNNTTLTGVKYGDNIPLPPDPVWTGNTFDGWINFPVDGKMSAYNLEIVARWSGHIHTITFDSDGGSEISPITAYYGEVLSKPNNPTRTGYVFMGWNIEIPSYMPDTNVTIKATWKKIDGSSDGGNGGGGSHGGGGGGGSIPYISNETGGIVSSDDLQQHGSAENIGEVVTGGVYDEVYEAYQWAYQNRITTILGFENANPDGFILRGHMAKMVVNFTENVLGRNVPSEIPIECNWGDDDSEWESEEIKDYARKSCALGIMGINMEEFLPNQEVSRAEFGTVLSRLLWGNKYDVINTDEIIYYANHLYALKKASIMTQVDNPLERKELRGWVWVMLRRSRVRMEDEKLEDLK